MDSYSMSIFSNIPLIWCSCDSQVTLKYTRFWSLVPNPYHCRVSQLGFGKFELPTWRAHFTSMPALGTFHFTTIMQLNLHCINLTYKNYHVYYKVQKPIRAIPFLIKYILGLLDQRFLSTIEVFFPESKLRFQFVIKIQIWRFISRF